MLKGLLSLYSFKFAIIVVYMLQSTEYQPETYLKWLWRVADFNRVMYRKVLYLTLPARLLLTAMRAGLALHLIIGAWFIYLALTPVSLVNLVLALAFLLAAPVVWAHLIVAPLLLGRWLIINPYYWLEIKRAAKIFERHQGAKIAIAGSYGKTTMKEILAAVLGAGQKVAATPANKNVAISHANFAKSLAGDEEILIIEYGEGKPGDVARFTAYTKPNMGVITGLAPAHLDKYRTLEAAGRDIFSLADYLHDEDVYINGESAELAPYVKKNHVLYTSERVAGWTISDIKVKVDSLSFKMKKETETLNIKSGLIGRQLVGPLALAVYFGHESGMSKSQIEKAAAAIVPFEHRMQPRKIGGAWVIDDTYNGNIEGMEAGLGLLAELPAKRKIYVTPGLVDQGGETKAIHIRLGKAIAAVKPDKVVLMKNSVTDYIVDGINEQNYDGELVIESDPLDFYNNLDHQVASGDLLLMQNDWPDNYY